VTGSTQAGVDVRRNHIADALHLDHHVTGRRSSLNTQSHVVTSSIQCQPSATPARSRENVIHQHQHARATVFPGSRPNVALRVSMNVLVYHDISHQEDRSQTKFQKKPSNSSTSCVRRWSNASASSGVVRIDLSIGSPGERTCR